MTDKATPHLTGMILTLCILLSWFSLPAPAQQGQAQVQQLIEAGTVTPQQTEQAIEAVNKGQVSPEALEQLQKEGSLGTLTPAEIEAGKRLLEQQQEEAPEGRHPRVASLIFLVCHGCAALVRLRVRAGRN